MADGSTKAIKDIKVGDEVVATDPVTGEQGPRVVTHLWVHEDELVALTVNGKVVTTTEDHPFWNATDQQWQRADELDPGDLLRTPTGAGTSVDVSASGLPKRGTAYNLSVANLHTYYVLAGNTPVLVHNTGCDEWAAAFAKRSGGEIKTFVGAGGDQLPMGPYRPKGPGTPELGESWFHHTVVVRGGKVYDQWYKSGIGVNEYKTRFDY